MYPQVFQVPVLFDKASVAQQDAFIHDVLEADVPEDELLFCVNHHGFFG